MIVHASVSRDYSNFFFFLHYVYLIEANRIVSLYHIYSEIPVFFFFFKPKNLQFNLSMQFYRIFLLLQHENQRENFS